MSDRIKRIIALSVTIFICALVTVIPSSTKDVSAQTTAAQESESVAVPERHASITSVTINSDKSTIDIKYTSDGDYTGTDGKIYLLEEKPYQNDVTTRTDYLDMASGGLSGTFTTTLNLGTSSSKLYSKFVLCVWNTTDNKYEALSNRHYVTNPELIAQNSEPFNDPLTKKGLNIELNMLADAFELGVKHVATNIAFSQIEGEGIDYEYAGKTYHFSSAVMANYDKFISSVSEKDMNVTVILLNDWNDNRPNLIYPGTSKSSEANYYMFNVETEQGFEETAAIISFLAKRYDGTDNRYGKVSNWIVGNEINSQLWNYMGRTDINTYVAAYEKAFRVFYTAIKSVSANDRVYFSLDYFWNAVSDGKTNYNYRGKSIIDVFNSIANNEGQFDWGIAYHPYPYPMNEPEFWDDAQMGVIKQDETSPIVNFANLSVLTDYMNNDLRKKSDGSVRHIILTEEGFTAASASKGSVEDIQAAAYAYSYYIVDSNPYIEAYIVSRQVDAPVEVNAGLSFGLWSCDMSRPNEIVAFKRRKIWQVFKAIDKKASTLEATEFAKSIIGINKWSDVIPNFRWRALEK